MSLKYAIHAIVISFLVGLSLNSWAQTQPIDETALPIDIEANQLDAQDQQGLTVYRGDVIATQGTLTLQGDQLEIHHPERQIQKITTTGMPATFKRFLTEENAWVSGQARTIIYLTETRTVELIGQAYLEQEGRHKIEGPKLVYDMNAQTLNAGQTDDESGRIKMTITPKTEASPSQGDN
ncbi:MAG: lipopolysaccharide transport periplasmic protein LptA [Thiomicrospira sp.]|uniref:lipopolysaccharide transport periplasmic protein LptA n=1 Tax=Thiomicrospira sp. TaxID=935 RepID=UPI0019E98AA5|nr:lipopolysaccharide transport periplasmic protein LptA [Thiomicrospira sp.]MBE0493584.1 lipopolysaccharide transport periplasmic protein LptA [Thiomicrospira sp.]